MRINRLIVLSMIAIASAFGQTVGASAQGTVTDPSGSAIPRAAVEITNIATGTVRSVTADAAGLWREPILQPGEYQVRIAAAGFQTTVRKGIELSVGQNAVLDITLEVGQTKSEIDVTASAAQINLVSGQVSSLVDQKQMRDLPLNGRSFQQLALLEPGVNAVNTGGNDPVGGRTPKISINGTRPEHSSFLLDGTDINDVYNKTPGSVGGVLLGVEAVLEFQVLTNSYSAEFGRSAGGVINAVTRGGGNRIHGSAFEFLRNSHVDAKNFFDPATAPIPPFKRNQFGGVVGGPIIRDKTFFFGSFESLIERLGLTGVTSVPTASARLGILPAGRVTVNPSIQPVIDALFPLPNGRDLGGGIGQYLFTRSQPTDEYFAQGRIDHQFSSANSLFGRYTFDNGNVDRPPTTKVPVTNTKERSRNQYVTLNYLHAFSPALVNTARLAFARSDHESNNAHTLDIPSSLTWIAGQPLGYLTVQGMATEDFGDYRIPRLDRLNNYQFGDTLFLNRGRHSVKTGFDVQRIQFNQNTTSQVGGVLTFTNVSNFLQGLPSQLDFAIPGGIDPVRGYRQTLLALFVQDDVKLRRNLTVNLGLRYETVTVPTEVNGKIANLRTPLDPAITVGGDWYKNPSRKNFAPRIGLAWDPFHDGKTSVRAGFGLFDDELLPKYYFFSGSLNPPFTSRASVVNPRFPNLLATFNRAAVKYNLQTSNYDLQNPYTLQFNAAIQRVLPRDWLIGAGYSGSRGLHLLRIGEANTAPWREINGVKVYTSGVGRLNPNFNSITQRISDAQSYYNALQLTAQKQTATGLRAQVSYTFSRAVDDSSGVNSQDYSNGSAYVIDYWDRKADRGLSTFWAQHVLTGNASWELPIAKNATGPAAALLKGWQINAITTLQTGHPFSVRMGFNRSANLNTVTYAMNERPNVNPAYTGNPILGGPDRYWDINAFVLPAAGQRGNLGRDTLIGPGLFNLDTSVMKRFDLREFAHLEFRTEFFNVLNHPNFGVPSGLTSFTGVSAAGAPTIAANWGVITNTVTTSRQLQFALKLTF